MDLLAEIDRRARWRSVIYLLTILLYASLSCQDRSGKESLFPGRLFAKTDVEAPFVKDKSPAAVFVSRMMGSFRRSTFRPLGYVGSLLGDLLDRPRRLRERERLLARETRAGLGVT